MSLNGETHVMRNGRLTSQVSIYNYPEHLNPFYEDDQHRRLRFWKLSKKDQDGNTRRSTFSLSALRDVWSFKSFRLKKRSSTLGVNKTSESPPMLRRDLQYSSLTDNTFSSHNFPGRYSLKNDGVGQRSVSQENHLHGNEYQSNGLAFERNLPYRRTTQLTQVSRAPNQTQALTTPPRRRSMQASGGGVGNPFDTETDDEVAGDTRSLSSNKRAARKKYRAPPPPPPRAMNGGNHSVVAGATTEMANETELNISNLTAEIESFVNAQSAKSLENELNRPARQGEIVLNTNQMPSPKTPPDHKVLNTSQSTRFTTTKVTTTRVTSHSPKHDRAAHPLPLANGNAANDNSNANLHRESTPSPSPKDAASSELESMSVPKLIAAAELKITEESDAVVKESRSSPKESNFRREHSPPSYSETVRAPPNGAPATTANGGQRFSTSAPLKMEPKEASPKPINRGLPPSPPRDDRANNPKRDQSKAPPTPIRSDQTRVKVIFTNTNNGTPVALRKVYQNGVPPAPAPHDQIEEIAVPVRNTVTRETVTLGTFAALPQKSPLNNRRTLPAPISVPVAIPAPVRASVPISMEAAAPPEPLKIVEGPEDASDSLNKRSSESVDNVAGSPSNPSNSASEFGRAEGWSNDPMTFGWKSSSLAPLKSNAGTGQKRSVKEIIESINRSQRLLNAAAHKNDSVVPLSPTLERASSSTKLNNTNDSNTNEHLRHSIHLEASSSQGADLPNRNISGGSSNIGSGSDENLSESLEPNSSKCNNVEVIKKYKLNKDVFDYRETSPTSSNLDWNPVPKPKRSKNL